MDLKARTKAFRTELGQDRLLLWCFRVSAALVLAHLALYAWKLLPLAGRQDPLAIHYSVLLGIDRLGPWYLTLYPPILALGSFLLDWAVAFRLRRRGRPEIAAMTALFTTTLLAFFLGGTVVTVLLNVGV